ncbi:MAG TPA: hypothetical protein VG621_00510 [Candidatus Paceibacterota bacterium]|nr:hypothetical protein [Candidatus Paceibacterota bacterium]
MGEKKKYVDINNVRSEEMRQKWQKIIDEGVDPFDVKHVEKMVGRIMAESKYWYAFHNNYPYPGTQYQPVIVSKNFYTDDDEMTDEEWFDLRTIKRMVKEILAIKGGGFVMRFGDTSISGGSVTHLHAHLIVPKENENVSAWFGSKKET